MLCLVDRVFVVGFSTLAIKASFCKDDDDNCKSTRSLSRHFSCCFENRYSLAVVHINGNHYTFACPCDTWKRTRREYSPAGPKIPSYPSQGWNCSFFMMYHTREYDTAGCIMLSTIVQGLVVFHATFDNNFYLTIQENSNCVMRPSTNYLSF